MKPFLFVAAFMVLAAGVTWWWLRPICGNTWTTPADALNYIGEPPPDRKIVRYTCARPRGHAGSHRDAEGDASWPESLSDGWVAEDANLVVTNIRCFGNGREVE